MQWSQSIPILRMNIRTFGDKQFGDLLVILKSRRIQRSMSIFILRIHIRTSSQELLYCFDVTTACRTMNCPMFAAVFAEGIGGFGFFIKKSHV